MKIGGYIFLLLGLLILVLSVGNIISYSKKNNEYLSTTATIVDYKVESGRVSGDIIEIERSKEKYIIFEYIVEEQKYRKKSYTSYVNKNNIGMTINIKYNPTDPRDIIIVGEESLYGMPIFGVVFTLVGLVITIKLRKN